MDKLKTRTRVAKEQSRFFEVTVSLLRIDEDGSEKKVKETAVIEAPVFGEAEKTAFRAYDGNKDTSVTKMSVAPYSEIICRDGISLEDGKFYLCRCVFISEDPDTGRKKGTTVAYLVKAIDTEEAQNILSSNLCDTICDYNIVSITETRIIGIIED